jgi:hypothetical protein
MTSIKEKKGLVALKRAEKMYLKKRRKEYV